MGVAEAYRSFGRLEARGESAVYEELARRVAGDAELVRLIEDLPYRQRQPNLLFAAVRYLGGPVEDYPAFRTWTLGAWERVRRVMAERRTQTNEPGRCAVLLPVLAALPQPLALIEVGASAGLCLYPDRYRYRYGDGPLIGPQDSPVTLECRVDGPVPGGVPDGVPGGVPVVVWRAGVDLNPLDVRDPDDVRWLESLVWPDQPERLRRLRGAVEVARQEPPRLVRGDLNEAVEELVAAVPAGATPVVFHSSVLVYLPGEARESFTARMRRLPGHWVSNEPPGVLPSVDELMPLPAPEGRMVSMLALDGRPLAFTGLHGQFLERFS
ncbi:DUF2332 domain-containing protein [Actinomadura sp. ATCC 31491]|uniref:DUF2332 domain-containing protein n=1 Tax=Actinomadura luzonensis TaxID=2805427 RepID=A0ABT0FMP1_9ACTN|nr:DUF2332 domain-containing protein [Actinomadura luzonensis]MCK2213438.1 DUF2332 domain-containing protein [Actinomadura luzonensis]